ncbi:hypothetical protein ACFE04_025979 [Oxalis oulophora]
MASYYWNSLSGSTYAKGSLSLLMECLVHFGEHVSRMEQRSLSLMREISNWIPDDRLCYVLLVDCVAHKRNIETKTSPKLDVKHIFIIIQRAGIKENLGTKFKLSSNYNYTVMTTGRDYTELPIGKVTAGYSEKLN